MTKDEAHRLFNYKDGFLYWNVCPNRRIRAGDVVGSRMKSGYWQAGVNKKQWYVHRLIFLYHHGHLPDFVDHIDGNKENNRIENLRAASATENQQNRRIGRVNSSGVKGVCWHKQRGKWLARVKINGKQVSAGLFSTLEEATNAVQKLRLNLHEEFTNHG